MADGNGMVGVEGVLVDMMDSSEDEGGDRSFVENGAGNLEGRDGEL